MIEAMAQVGGIVMLQEPVTDGKGEFFFAGVDNVRWRKVVVPGDTLVMEMELTAFKKRFGVGKMTGKYVVLLYSNYILMIKKKFDSNLHLCVFLLCLGHLSMELLQSKAILRSHTMRQSRNR
uniref:Uncharacterized protein n=1 Tax=Timspurckia oligopyrenoides TaxID=708627 RepID=A0A7S1EUR3_9RHOD|mmetsp:Transcript_9367/g.16884  ORF Transcript_9367/g.16884 Transcript_9367/m.16884 type:complete len:122 (+) Transcript_9367:1-366(+)